MPSLQFLKTVELLIYDCDGVLTDNKVLVDGEGHEYAIFNRGDGYAISCLKKIGYKQIIVSTESNPIVKARGEKLKLDVIHNTEDKESIVKEYCAKNNISLEKVMFIGNDLNDRDAMMAVGYRGCPMDAEPEILDISDWVSTKKGGDGVIRELYREITKVAD